MHKYQVKSAAVDDNIQESTGKISHHYEEDGRAKSKSTMKNNENTEELSQMMCSLLCHQSAPWDNRKSTGLTLFYVSIQGSCGLQNWRSAWKIGITFEIQWRRSQGDNKT